jgi:hypothetical protein
MGLFRGFSDLAVSWPAKLVPAKAGSGPSCTPGAGDDSREARDCMGLFLRFRLHGVIPRIPTAWGYSSEFSAAWRGDGDAARQGAAQMCATAGSLGLCHSFAHSSSWSCAFLSVSTSCHLVSPFSRARCALHAKNDGSSTERERAMDGARDALRRASRGAAKSAARSAGCVASSATMRMRCSPWQARHSARRPRGICSAAATFCAGAIPSRRIGACVRWAFRDGGRRAAIAKRRGDYCGRLAASPLSCGSSSAPELGWGTVLLPLRGCGVLDGPLPAFAGTIFADHDNGEVSLSLAPMDATLRCRIPDVSLSRRRLAGLTAWVPTGTPLRLTCSVHDVRLHRGRIESIS